jgi:hypothetical protein
MLARRTIVAAALALALFVPSVAQSAPAGSITVPVTQTLSGIGTFTGQLSVNRFTTVDGQLAAVGTLSGQITDTAGNLLGTIVTAVTVPVSNASGSCSILHLTLGPLDLNLLGLQVHLDRIVLDISAQPGPGNLLGNLLCSIANLLNGGGPLTQLVNALNQLLASL